jgi:hypothetical protein
MVDENGLCDDETYQNLGHCRLKKEDERTYNE